MLVVLSWGVFWIAPRATGSLQRFYDAAYIFVIQLYECLYRARFSFDMSALALPLHWAQ